MSKRCFTCLALSVLIVGLVVTAGLGANDSYVRVQQSVDGQESLQQVGAIQSSVDPVAFYSFANGASNTGLEVSRHSLVIPYKGPDGTNSLIIIHGKSNDNSGGSASFTISGLPQGAQLALLDDRVDYRDTADFSPPEATFSWTWDPPYGDGAVITNLGENFSVRINPSFTSGVEVWELVGGSRNNPTRVQLNPNRPITVGSSSNNPPSATFQTAADRWIAKKPGMFDATGSYDPNGQIARYEWDFDGDGTFTASTKKPKIEHTYDQGGSYQVQLRVVDDEGQTNTITKTVNVQDVLVDVKRSISAGTAMPSSIIRISLQIEAHAKVSGFGVDEKLPSNWTIRPVEDAGAAFKAPQTQWLFTEALQAGETREIIYEAVIPSAGNLVSAPLPTTVQLSGSMEAASPSFQATIKGDTSLEIQETLPVSTVIAHYDYEVKELDMRMDKTINQSQLKWAADLWVRDATVPNSGGELIGFTDIKELTVYAATETPVSQALQSVQIPEMQATRTIYSQLPFDLLLLSPAGGENDFESNFFNVDIRLRAINRKLMGLGYEENLPHGWELDAINYDGAVFKPSTDQWVFLKPVPSGEERVLTYKARVPKNEELGKYSIMGRMSEAWSGYSEETGGTASIEVVDKLPVKVVISRWNVSEDKLDLTLGNSITYRQVKRALVFWLENSDVPYTGGKKLDFEAIKSIVAYWVEGVPITKTL